MASLDRFGVEEGVVYSNPRATWWVRDNILVVQRDSREKRVALNGRRVENHGNRFLAISGEDPMTDWQTVDILEPWPHE